ncbi:MAG: hypothetical protein II735_06970 [Clostridia bacterium]|nr:hypothetical protein [Clostridia bacterium]
MKTLIRLVSAGLLSAVCLLSVSGCSSEKNSAEIPSVSVPALSVSSPVSSIPDNSEATAAQNAPAIEGKWHEKATDTYWIFYADGTYIIESASGFSYGSHNYTIEDNVLTLHAGTDKASRLTFVIEGNELKATDENGGISVMVRAEGDGKKEKQERASQLSFACSTYYRAIIYDNINAENPRDVTCDSLPSRSDPYSRKKVIAKSCTIEGAMQYTRMTFSDSELAGFCVTEGGRIVLKEDAEGTVIVPELTKETTLEALGY